MNRSVILAIMATVATLPVYGQGLAPSLNQPIGESELLRSVEELGSTTTRAARPVTQLAQAKAPAASDEKPRKEGTGTTEITAKEAAFDQKTSQAVFLGDVRVKNPQFNVDCDKLTAFLKKDGKEAPKPNGDAVKPAPAPKPAAKKGSSTGGLDKAIAEGSVVITQEKVDAAGELTRNVGRAKRAVFDSSTGDITLTGSPQVEQGINTIVATEESTVMILNQEGRMRVIGPHRTVIKDTADANAR